MAGVGVGGRKLGKRKLKRARQIGVGGLTTTRESDVARAKTCTRLIIGDGVAALRVLASSTELEGRLEFARTVVFCAVASYWKAMAPPEGRRWPLRKLACGVGIGPRSAEATKLAERIGTAAAVLDPVEAAYRVGLLYTGTMPSNVRSELGACYTPPALCERLLDMATEAGVDWGSAHVLDPACGGGAFSRRSHAGWRRVSMNAAPRRR